MDSSLFLDELDIVTVEVVAPTTIEGGTGLSCRWGSRSVSSSHDSCSALN